MKNNPEIKKMYDSFLESGELFEVLPNSTGEWSKDKIAFKHIYEQLYYSVEHVDEFAKISEPVKVDEEGTF